MNTKRLSRWLTVGVVGLGAAGAPAAAQRHGGYNNGGYNNGGYNNGGYNNGGRVGGFGQGGFRGGRQAPNAAWSEIDKTPRFGTDSRPGYYVWRQGDEVFVVANTPNRRDGRRFAGEVTVQGGSLSRVQGYRTERRDQFLQQDGNTARFAFDTSRGLDGVKFHVDGGRRIVVRLQGFNQDGDRFFLGQDKIGATVNPLVIEK